MLRLSGPRSQERLPGAILEERYSVTPLVDVHGVTMKRRVSGAYSGPSDATRGLDIQEQIDHIEGVIRVIWWPSDN